MKIKVQVRPQTNKEMGPTAEFSNIPNQEENDVQPSVEDMKAFQHARNMTGVVGDSKWHSDIKVNELWDNLSVPESSGNNKTALYSEP